MYDILLFYKYIYIDDPEKLAFEQRLLQETLGLKGRSIIAKEGINITLEGTPENVDAYLSALLRDDRFKDVHIKRSKGTGTAFPKLSVKVRPEIVALGLGSCDVDPNKVTGTHLKPEELHDWIAEKKEFYIVDMRNYYEQDVGRFDGSICVPMENFRDLPKFMESIAHLKDKTVLTVCTGGVRCEKASGYLITQGFKNVYQLDGGIVSYMEKYPNEDFLGKLYVFDSRLIMGFYTDDPNHKVIGTCNSCGEQSERFTNCKEPICHRQMILCEPCDQKQTGVYCKQGCRDRFAVKA